MKAAVLRKFGENLKIEELSIPDLDENQVLVDIKFTGICGAQVNQKKGIKIEEKFLPCLMGHEGSGVVLAVGPKVNKVKSGDHVVLHWRKSSGVDSKFPNFYSKSTQENIGAGLITTFSEQSIVSENRITKIDSHYPLDIASLLGCGVTTGIGIINNGELLLVEEKNKLIKRMSVKTLRVKLKKPITKIPKDLEKYKLKLIDDGKSFNYYYKTGNVKTGITSLLSDMNNIGMNLFDIQTEETSLEEIFVKIIKD